MGSLCQLARLPLGFTASGAAFGPLEVQPGKREDGQDDHSRGDQPRHGRTKR